MGFAFFARRVRKALVLGVLGLAAVAPARAQSNPIVVENALPGSPPSAWDVPVGDASIQGFATEMSVAPGETIAFKVNTPATNYRIDIYRMGYYGGLGARQVATVEPSASLPQAQPAHLYDITTRTIDCGNWSVSASWNVPASAVSGIYIAKLVREDPEDGRASHIVFVVRDDERHAEILFQTSDATWQAYNHYQGYSLYSNPRSYKVSYNRPMVLRGNEPWDWVFNAEYPMLRWLERNGYDVSYSSSADSERRGAEILEHAVFLSVGHDEYWSRGQREAVEAARDAGVHLAFLSGNEIYWKTRWEPSIAAGAVPYRTLVCYKESQAGAKIDPLPNVWTGLWRDCSLSPPADGCDPENQLSGQMSWTTTLCGGVACGIQVPSIYAPMRLWRFTNIATLLPGQVATFPPATLGFEWDYQQAEASAPAGLVWLSSTTASGLTHHLTLYRAASGALVFGAGTIQWAWGLDDQHTYARYPPVNGAPPDGRMQQVTVNLLAETGVQPGTLQAGLVASGATTDATPPASAIGSPASGAFLLSGAVVIQGTAVDAGGVVGAVEISVDGGATWKRAQGLENWSYTWQAPPHAGTVALRSRATDDLGHVETPTAGITVTVGGPPIELEAIDAPDSVYVNGLETAHFDVLSRSNAGAAAGLSLRVWLTSNLGESFELGTDAFALTAGGVHQSHFSWPVPAAGQPWEFAVHAELSQGGQGLGTLVRKAAFSGTTMSHAELQAARELVAGPAGCLAPATACRPEVLAAIPSFGSTANFTAASVGFCKTEVALAAGDRIAAGGLGFAALLGAVDVTLDALPAAGNVTDVLPSTVAAELACNASLLVEGLTPLLPDPARALDSLAAVAATAFVEAGRDYSNEFFTSGPVDLRIGCNGHWTSRQIVDLRRAGVFGIGTTGITWGHAGRQLQPLGPDVPNPHDVVAIQLRATADGVVEFGYRHHTAADSILWIRYAPIPVVAGKTLMNASISDALPYPWGYPLFVDTQGDGVVDQIVYPGGTTPSDAPVMGAPRFQLLPCVPNPFNPTTRIRYVLPAAGPVTVTLHDVRGRIVDTLFHGTQAAGLQSLRWSGVPAGGGAVPSGIYVVRVVTPWGMASEKLVLVK